MQLAKKQPKQTSVSEKEYQEEGEESVSMDSESSSGNVSENENITTDDKTERIEQLDSNTDSEQEENRY